MIFWIFTLLIMVAPLPFGLVYEVSQAVFAVLVFGLAAVLYGYLMLRKNAGQVTLLPRIGLEWAAFAGVMGWAVFQILPVAPAELHHPLWAEAGKALGQDIAGAISLAPGAGIHSMMRLFTYAAVFWITLQLTRDRHRAKYFVDALIVAGTLYAAYGLIMNLTEFQKIPWMDKGRNAGLVTGTLVNQNNFATYAGMVLLCAVGAYQSMFHEVARQSRRGRDRLVAFLDTALVQGAPRLGSILILAAALLMSASRAGITFSLFSLAVLMLLFGAVHSYRRGLYSFTTLILTVALFFGVFAHWDVFLQRMSALSLAKEHRLVYYEQVWQAIGSAPWTGFGLGSFAQAFPLYADIQTSSLDKAHNDWLEMIFELGWPAALLWFGLLAVLTARCLAGFFRRGRDQLYPLVGFCAGLLVGLHAMVDFSLQVPAVAITFAALLGLGMAQSFSSKAAG